MPLLKESHAVAVARAHAEAWSRHDWDKARRSLSADVKITATTTQPIMPPTSLTGVDNYMRGLKEFARPVEPGSLRVIESLGDERNALLMVSVKAAYGPGPKVTLTQGRLYLIDEDDRIKVEQVIFFAVPD